MKLQPVLEFVRPYAPELVGWFRDFGGGAANYDANGHYARVQPIFNAFQFTDDPAGGVLTPSPPDERLDGLETGQLASLPGRRLTARRGRLGTVARHERHARLRSRPGAAGTMTRALAVAAILLVAAVLAAVALTGSEDESYRVRAIFDNAGFVIPGEDVRVAGVKVGSVEAVDVTPDFKAAVVLDIEDEGYQDFRADARCRVRPQSLIGERFVECEPTQRRGAGAEAPGALRQIEDGAGEGQYLLPVDRTETTVDLDLINNVMREPYRERLSIILNELGTGLAGRGTDLDAVIRRANPALRELDEVLQLLARQNKQLEALAVDGDRIMAPLARERTRVVRGDREHQHGRRGDGVAPGGAGGELRAAAALPARAAAHDGRPRDAGRGDDAGGVRPRRRRARPQPHHRGARARSRRPASRRSPRSARRGRAASRTCRRRCR